MNVNNGKQSIATRIRLFHFGLDVLCAVNTDKIYDVLSVGAKVQSYIVKMVKALNVMAHAWKILVVLASVPCIPSLLKLLQFIVMSGNWAYLAEFFGLIAIITALFAPAKDWLKLTKKVDVLQLRQK